MFYFLTYLKYHRFDIEFQLIFSSDVTLTTATPSIALAYKREHIHGRHAFDVKEFTGFITSQ